MDANAIDTAVRTLHQARESGTLIDSLPDGAQPQNEADAYAIADAWAVSAPWQVSGWKIGATAEVAQKMLGVDGPFSGRVFEPFVHRSPAAPTDTTWVGARVEAEFAFAIGSDLGPRDTPYERADVEAAIGAVHPAIEIVATRFADLTTAGGPNLMADCGGNGGLVVGDPVINWRGHDLAAAEVTMTVDGTEVGRGTGADVLGHPIDALCWLVNHLTARGITLDAGQLVSTGTCTGVAPLPAGSTAIADHGPLGTVTLTL